MFELDQDLKKEKAAIELYLKRSGETYKKLGASDVDFRIIGNNKSRSKIIDVLYFNKILKKAIKMRILKDSVDAQIKMAKIYRSNRFK